MTSRKFGLAAFLAAVALLVALPAAGLATTSSVTKALGQPILFNQHGKTVPVQYFPNYSNGTSAVHYQEPNNTNVTMVCWRDTDLNYKGNYKSVRWFYIRYKYGHFSSREGWVHSSYVYYQTPKTPRC